jgi:hypothetical protein
MAYESIFNTEWRMAGEKMRKSNEAWRALSPGPMTPGFVLEA